MLVYVPDGDVADDPLAEWLRASIPPERLTLSHVSDIYPADGRFDGPATAATFRELGASARAEGWSTLRAMADLTRLATDAEVADDLLRYELLIDGTIEDEGFHGFCVYDRYAAAEGLDALTATHRAHDHSSLPTARVRDDVLHLGGELDLLGSTPIREVLAVAPDDVSVVALDGLSLLDASGARALWEFATERDRRGTPVTFEGASRTASMVLSVYGLAA